jgi:phenylacetate-CoA ligase
LPVLTKAMVMEHFDELVTDPAVRLAEVEAHLATLEGNERLCGRYWVAATSGTTGRRGVFLWNLDEWVTVLASYNRFLDWAGATAGLTRRLRMAVVSSTTPWHQSAQVGATVHSPWLQTLRIDSGDPLEHILERLDRFQPQVLVGYASMLRLLASEQLAGRLTIAPEVVFSASEVMTGDTRRGRTGLGPATLRCLRGHRDGRHRVRMPAPCRPASVRGPGRHRGGGRRPSTRAPWRPG